jgi:hypothetical protein
MPILVTPVTEPISHKHAVKLADTANQAAILIKNTLANGSPASGNDPAVKAEDIRGHFSADDLKKLEAIAAIA